MERRDIGRLAGGCRRVATGVVKQAAVAIALAATVGGTSEAADFVGFASETSVVTSGGVEYSVIDVFAEFAQSSVVLVNAYNSSISNANASAFHHSDLNTLQSLAGTWAPTLTLALPGLDPAVDSFVIIGGTPGSSSTTALDPNFSPATALVPPTNAGWYNSNPPNAQGAANAEGRVFIGRFVTAASLTPDTLNFTASVTFADFDGTTTGSPQQGTDTIAVTYAAPACDSLSALADSTNFDSAGSASPVSVAVDVASPLCSWSASSDAAWITLSASGGTGDGSFTFSVDANPATVARQGVITVSSGTASDVQITIDQDALPCAVTGFTPATAEFTAVGGNGSTTISTNGSNCGWSASSDAAWLVITSGASGTGTSGTIAYTVATNTVAASRTATITANGQTHVVTQAAADCTVSLDPATASFDAAGGSGSVSVTTNGDACSWSASSDAAWLVITSGDSGTGTSGTIAYTVATNTVAAARDGDDHRERPDACGDAGGCRLHGEP